MPTFKKYKLSEVCTKIGSGSTPRGGDAAYKKEGISLIRSQNVLDFIFSENGLAFIDDQQAKELSNVTIEKDDVLINITGDSVARVCQVPDDILPARVNQHVAILRANKALLNSDFLKYALLTRENKEQLLSLASTGATRKALTKTMLEEFEILAPSDLPTQTRIASILSALDDKIELNRQMNQTLEQMAQALFKKYFVDDIDPDNLHEGWRWGKLGDYIDTVSHTHKFPKSEVIFLNTSDIFGGEVLHNNYTSVDGLPGQAKKSIQRNDILFSEIRPANRRFAFVNFEANDFVVSTKLMVLRAKNEIHPLFMYYFLTRNEILDELQNIAESRSGTFPQITFDQIKDLKFLIPNDGRLETFIEKVLLPNYEKMFLNNEETKSLIQIRDTLLPKLMSGEIEVNAEVENEVFS